MQPVQDQNRNPALPNALSHLTGIETFFRLMEEIHLVIQQFKLYFPAVALFCSEKLASSLQGVLSAKVHQFVAYKEGDESVRQLFEKLERGGTLLNRVLEVAHKEQIILSPEKKVAEGKSRLPELQGSPKQTKESGGNSSRFDAPVARQIKPEAAPALEKRVSLNVYPQAKMNFQGASLFAREGVGIAESFRAIKLIQEHLIVIVETQENMAKLPQKPPQLKRAFVELPPLSLALSFFKAPFVPTAKSSKEVVQGEPAKERLPVSPKGEIASPAPHRPSAEAPLRPEKPPSLANDLFSQPKREGEVPLNSASDSSRPPHFPLPYVEQRRPLRERKKAPSKKEKDLRRSKEEEEEDQAP